MPYRLPRSQGSRVSRPRSGAGSRWSSQRSTPGKSDAARANGIEKGRTVLELAMDTKGSSAFIAGDLSLADLYLAPIAFYLSLTPDKDTVFDVPGFADWWVRIQALQS